MKNFNKEQLSELIDIFYPCFHYSRGKDIFTSETFSGVSSFVQKTINNKSLSQNDFKNLITDNLSYAINESVLINLFNLNAEYFRKIDKLKYKKFIHIHQSKGFNFVPSFEQLIISNYSKSHNVNFFINSLISLTDKFPNLKTNQHVYFIKNCYDVFHEINYALNLKNKKFVKKINNLINYSHFEDAQNALTEVLSHVRNEDKNEVSNYIVSCAHKSQNKNKDTNDESYKFQEKHHLLIEGNKNSFSLFDEFLSLKIIQNLHPLLLHHESFESVNQKKDFVFSTSDISRIDYVKNIFKEIHLNLPEIYTHYKKSASNYQQFSHNCQQIFLAHILNTQLSEKNEVKKIKI